MVLLDTHAFIWMFYKPECLSTEALRAIHEDDLSISIASLWEISIKKTRKKLVFSETIPQIADICRKQGIDILPIEPEHCQMIQMLPLFHRDPFDRIIMAQSLVERWPLVTRDRNIWEGYPEVDKIW